MPRQPFIRGPGNPGTRRKRALVAVLLLAAALAGFPAHAQTGSFEQSGLVGKLEGATLVLDPAAMPKQFHEAPMLDAQVQAGTLPPVAARLPQDPLVIGPLRQIGTYGGTWRRGFIGPSDGESGNRINATEKLLFWDTTGTRIVPSVAKGWPVSADGRTTTLYLRHGMKWSDGAPFGADDFVFWFDDIYHNHDLSPVEMDDQPGRIVKIDDTTVAFPFDRPYYTFIQVLAGDTPIGAGQSPQQSEWAASATASRRRITLRQFLPKYSSLDAVTRAAKAAGYNNWVGMVSRQGRLAAEPRPAGASAHGTWCGRSILQISCSTQSLLLRSRYLRQPASLYRPHQHDAGR